MDRPPKWHSLVLFAKLSHLLIWVLALRQPMRQMGHLLLDLGAYSTRHEFFAAHSLLIASLLRRTMLALRTKPLLALYYALQVLEDVQMPVSYALDVELLEGVVLLLASRHEL